MAACFLVRRVLLAACLSVLALPACTSMLGIDGRYVDEQHAAGGAAPIDGAGGASDGGEPGAGGRTGGAGGSDSGNPMGSGGSNATGGLGGGGVDSMDSGPATGGAAGCTSCPPPPKTACTPGRYRGTISGHHSPSVTFVGVPLQVTGTLEFRLDVPDAGGMATIVDGSISGTVGVAGSPPFEATLVGSVNCATGHLDATMSGGFALVPNTAPVLAFDGTHTGAFGGGKFSGTWQESEVVVVSGNRPYKGDGTWTAAWAEP